MEADLEKLFEIPEVFESGPHTSYLWLYFIQGLQTGLIKIGKTQDFNVDKRLSSLQTGSPDKLILLKAVQYPAKYNCEKAVHRHFSEFRVHGEWFTPEPELMDFIDQIGAGLLVPLEETL